jgi:hypothetical protein
VVVQVLQLVLHQMILQLMQLLVLVVLYNLLNLHLLCGLVLPPFQDQQDLSINLLHLLHKD